MSTTPKKFIGVVHNDSFKLIGTWKPRAVACVAKGQLIGNTLKVSTSLHRAFLILFFFWLTIITGVGLFGLINLSTKVTDWMIAIFGLIVVASFFRLFLHIAYVVARRKFMIQFTDFLDHGGSWNRKYQISRWHLSDYKSDLFSFKVTNLQRASLIIWASTKSYPWYSERHQELVINADLNPLPPTKQKTAPCGAVLFAKSHDT